MWQFKDLGGTAKNKKKEKNEKLNNNDNERKNFLPLLTPAHKQI